MEGLIEILIIAAIFLLPALEAWTKQRKKGQRRGREAGGGAGAEAPSSEGWPGGGEGGRARGDQSAEVLLPEDLWEELTGQRRRAEEEGATDEARTVEEAGGDRWGPVEAPPEPEPGPAPWRETDRAEAPPGAADLGGRMGTGDFGYEGPSEPVTEEPAEAYRTHEPRRADVIREGGGRPARPRTHRSRIAELGGVRPGRAARRGVSPAGAGDVHPFLGELDRAALRRAVIWAEILGPPVSMREE